MAKATKEPKLKTIETEPKKTQGPTTISGSTRAEAAKISAARIEAAQANARWGELYNKSKKIKPPSYSLKSIYDPEGPIEHPKLGWGYILSKKNDRLEVLFEGGIKYLISNYK